MVVTCGNCKKDITESGGYVCSRCGDTFCLKCLSIPTKEHGGTLGKIIERSIEDDAILHPYVDREKRVKSIVKKLLAEGDIDPLCKLCDKNNRYWQGENVEEIDDLEEI